MIFLSHLISPNENITQNESQAQNTTQSRNTNQKQNSAKDSPQTTNDNGIVYKKRKTNTPKLSKDEFITTCETISYDDIARNPDIQSGKNVVFVGKVVQSMSYATIKTRKSRKTTFQLSLKSQKH